MAPNWVLNKVLYREVFEHSSIGFLARWVGLELKLVVVSGVGVGLVLARVELELDWLNLAMVWC